MQAVLMAGGRGTRLQPLTAVLPKPLVPLGDLSILEIVLHQLRYQGFLEVVLCVGHKAELIMAVVGDGDRYGLSVRYHVESEPLGTMGALRQVEGLEDNFLVMNGDVCTDLNFSSVLQHHCAQGCPATVATTRRFETIELGVLDLDPTGRRLVGFREKPSFDFWVAIGVNALSREVVELIPEDEQFGFDNMIAAMLAGGQTIEVFPFDGFWLDIGRPDDYRRMVEEFPKMRAQLLPGDADPESTKPPARRKVKS